MNPDPPHRAPSSPEQVFEHTLPVALSRVDRAPLPEDVVVAFHVEGEGGGSWQVERTQGPAQVGPARSGPFDCVVRCSAADFMDIVQGRIGSKEAFLSGRLHVTGDIGLALALRGFLRAA